MATRRPNVTVKDTSQKNPTAHAELVAIRDVVRMLESDLWGGEIYSCWEARPA